jgi:hypothetical protein
LKSQVIAIWRIGEQYQPRHARLEDNRVLAFQAQHDALANSIDSLDSLTAGAAAKDGQGRRDFDWPARPRAAMDVVDAAADDGRDASAHRFYFG